MLGGVKKLTGLLTARRPLSRWCKFFRGGEKKKFAVDLEGTDHGSETPDAARSTTALPQRHGSLRWLHLAPGDPHRERFFRRGVHGLVSGESRGLPVPKRKIQYQLVAVSLAWPQDGRQEVAVKAVSKSFFKQDPKVKENLEREIRIMKLLKNCEYVVRLEHVQVSQYAVSGG